MALAWVQVLVVVLAAVVVQLPAAVLDRAVAQVLAAVPVPVPVLAPVPGQVLVQGWVLVPAVAPVPAQAAGKILARAKVCPQAQAQLLSPVLTVAVAVAAPPVGGRPKRPPAALAGRRRHQRLLDSGHSAPNRRKSAVGQGRPETGLRKRGSR